MDYVLFEHDICAFMIAVAGYVVYLVLGSKGKDGKEDGKEDRKEDGIE